MNELHFSANGQGVVLKTKHGGLRFATEEFGYYQNLFIIIDSHNHGKLSINSMEINSLLIRTDLLWPVIEKILAVAIKHRVENEDDVIYFYQWLIICKLIAFHQETKRVINDKIFKILHTTKIKIPLVDFHLSQSKYDFQMGSYYEEYDVQLKNWYLVEDDYHSQHVKFRLESLSTTYNNTELTNNSSSNSTNSSEENHSRDSSNNSHHSSHNNSNNTSKKDTNNSNAPPPPTTTTTNTIHTLPNKTNTIKAKYIVERRYSEFEIFTTILQKNYKNIIIPPLPIKNWNLTDMLSSSKEEISIQRSIEFQLYLNNLITHPVLRYTFELKTFLQASIQGLKSFFDLYSHIEDGKINIYYNTNSPSSSYINDVVSKLLSDSATVVSNNANIFFNNIWSKVKNNIPTSLINSTTGMLINTTNTSTSSSITNNNHTIQYNNVFSKTMLYLEGVYNVGRKLEHIISLERSYYQEMMKIAHSYKNMAEFETIPELTRLLVISSNSMSIIAKQQLELLNTQHLNAEIPMIYIGRYKDSYQTVLNHRSKLAEEQQTAARAEQTAQHNVETAHNALILAGGQQPQVTTPLSQTHTNTTSTPQKGSSTHNDNAAVSSNSKNNSTATTTSAAPSAAEAITTTSAAPTTPIAASPSELRAAAAERLYNQAKLDLAAAEDNFEQRRTGCEQMDSSLLTESTRVEALERAQLMKCAKAFVFARMEAARRQTRAWEEMKEELEHS